MNEENLYDILELCLQEIENGADVDSVLARFPSHARELHPLLKVFTRIQNETPPAPASNPMRGRARLMQQIANSKEEKSAPRRSFPVFLRKLSMAVALTATLVASGGGLVGASASSLPGENLYHVKRGWEGLRLFLTFNNEARESLLKEFEEERLHEVNELLSEDEYSQVDFSGVLSSRNNEVYVAQVQVIFPEGAEIPNEGDIVHIIGWTTEHGYVEVAQFNVIQSNSAAPAVQPISTMPAPTENPQEQPVQIQTEEPTEAPDDDKTPEPSNDDKKNDDDGKKEPDDDGGSDDGEEPDNPEPPED